MIKLKRYYLKTCTIGTLTIDYKKELFFTLELPYLDNKQNISCIPPATYKLIKYYSPKFGECFKLENVRNRTNILIHSGNNLLHTQGCILIGNQINNNGIVMDSKNALIKLLNLLKEENEIEIS